LAKFNEIIIIMHTSPW